MSSARRVRRVLFVGWILAAAAPAAGGTLVSVCRQDGGLTMHDAVDLSGATFIATGPGPRGVAVTADGARAFVARHSPHPSTRGRERGVPENAVVVVDLRRREIAAVIALGTPGRPHDLRVSRRGDRLWVVCDSDPCLIEIDVATARLTRRWSTRQRGSQWLEVSPDERRLYVGSTGSGSVTVVDRAGSSSRTVAVPGGVDGIALSPDGRELWIANGDTGRISVLDAVTLRVRATLPGATGSPLPLRFARGGREVWLGAADPPGLWVYDASRGAVTARIALPESPRALLEGPDGDARVTQPFARRLLRVRLPSGVIVASADSGDGLEALALAPASPPPPRASR